MRERDINRQMFHAGHYNVIAGRFKRALEPYTVLYDLPVLGEETTSDKLLHARVALVDLALDMAYRLQADNELFDPIRFLTACSPDPVNLPLHELWDMDKYQLSLNMEMEN